MSPDCQRRGHKRLLDEVANSMPRARSWAWPDGLV